MVAFSTPSQPRPVDVVTTPCHIVDEPTVYPRSGGYMVLFGDGSKPVFVYKGQANPNDPRREETLEAVQKYLENGGEPVDEHRSNFWFVAPWECPLCGQPSRPDPRWNSPRRGAGWRCTSHQPLGKSHYWTFMVNCLRDHLQSEPILGVD
jgi:hypothetical protein